jgi:hypothetical protein
VVQVSIDAILAEGWGGPILRKRNTPTGSVDEPREYLPITWDFFLALRAWASWTAWRTGSHAYLVGSALVRDRPRDVDVALVWTSAEYERHFGPIPLNQEEYEARYHGPFKYARHAFLVSAWQGVGYKPYIDVHLCPDVWYRDRPRLLLGSPGEPVVLAEWKGKVFDLPTLIHQDGRVGFAWREGVCWDEH